LINTPNQACHRTSDEIDIVAAQKLAQARLPDH
jgi:hypothetical protein